MLQVKGQMDLEAQEEQEERELPLQGQEAVEGAVAVQEVLEGL